MTLQLSLLTQQLVEKLFEPSDQAEVSRLLIEECGNNLPFCKESDEYKMERIRFAALRVSIGYLGDLRSAIDLAKSDWRDLLVWARFADSLTAHQEWSEQVLKGNDNPMVIIVMGLPGSGKTTVCSLLLRKLNWMFYELDNFHATENFVKFMHGEPIGDEAMEAWLVKSSELVGKCVAKNQSMIFACSALKEQYRQRLRVDEKVHFVYLRGNYGQLEERQKNRKSSMPHVERLAYQYSIFEEPQNVLTIDIDKPAQEIAESICGELGIVLKHTEKEKKMPKKKSVQKLNKKMEAASTSENSLVISYLALRITVGVLGFALPILVPIGGILIFKDGIQSSLSSYYYTGMRDVFVGILWTIGFFLYSYRGYEPIDNIVGNLACLFAVGVSLFPTSPDNFVSQIANFIGVVHLIFAALFFLTLIYFSLFLFTRKNQNGQPTPEKLKRNMVYRICAYIMSVCIVLMAIFKFLPDSIASLFKAYDPVFWLETVAILAFGLSWFVKGGAIMQDQP